LSAGSIAIHLPQPLREELAFRAKFFLKNILRDFLKLFCVRFFKSFQRIFREIFEIYQNFCPEFFLKFFSGKIAQKKYKLGKNPEKRFQPPTGGPLPEPSLT